MKILLATAYDYPHLGGLSVHLTTLKAGLESRGHSVDIVSFSDVPKWKRDGVVRGPAFVFNKVKKGSGYVWTLKRRKDELESLIKEKVKDGGYDLINAQDAFTTLAALESDVPVVSTVHGYLTFEGISKGTVIEGSVEADQLMEAERQSYKATREVITVDTRIKDYIEKETGVVGNMIKNFIDVESFKPEMERRDEFREKYGFAKDDMIFFVPRRLTKKNGVIYPILSLPAVLEKFPKARVVFAGTGEMADEMKAKANELGISDRVTLVGAVDHSDILEYYALANVALVPSIYSAGVEEATSISALEAMGSGAPLIACAVGGLKEIIDDGVDGLLVEEQNVEALSDAMIRLLEDPVYAQKLADAARAKIVADYSHFAAAEKYEAIYLKALGKQ
ncbi:glycosyltransferase family 4 protein [Sporosarcina sp. FSL W8-0480]|uniref:glycosyltransferase family 4 protein n=1 Tax=Sporosarcina sp. FSL W8-0480 TaxID=2954701 RepID=UPI0030D8AAD0